MLISVYNNFVLYLLSILLHLYKNQQQLMNLENMSTFAQIYNLQVIASLGVGGELDWYIWRHWIKILGNDLLITIFLIFYILLKKTGI